MINCINNGLELLVCRALVFTVVAVDIKPSTIVDLYYRKFSMFLKYIHSSVSLATLLSIELVMLRLDHILLCHQMCGVVLTYVTVA